MELPSHKDILGKLSSAFPLLPSHDEITKEIENSPLFQQSQKTREQIREKISEPASTLFKSVTKQVLPTVQALGEAVDAVFGLPGRVATGFNENVPSGFSRQVEQATEQSTGSPFLGGVAGFVAGFIEPLGPKGKNLVSALTKETDVIKSLEILKGTFKNVPESNLAKIAEQTAPLTKPEEVNKVLATLTQKTFQKGDEITIRPKSKGGVERTAKIIEVRPDGIIAEGGGSFRLPILFKSEEFSFAKKTAEGGYSEWLQTNPEAIKKAGELSEQANTITNPKFKNDFLKEKKSEFDAEFSNKFSATQKNLAGEDIPIETTPQQGGLELRPAKDAFEKGTATSLEDVRAGQVEAIQAKQRGEQTLDLTPAKPPTTLDDFDRLPPDTQETTFADLPEELKMQILGDVDSYGSSPLDDLANKIASGKMKIKVGETLKTESRESYGKGNYMRIFTKDKNAQALDQIIDTFNRENGQDLSSSDLLDAVSTKLDKRAAIKAEEKAIREEVRESKKAAREAAKTPEQKKKVEAEIEKEVARERLKTRERGFITSAKEAFPELKAKVAGQYVPRATDPLAERARNIISSDIENAERIILNRTDDEAVAVASELVNHYGTLATKTDDLVQRNLFNDKAAEVANHFAEKLTELGRSVQAASILGKMTPAGQLRQASRIIQKFNEVNPTRKVPELTGEQAGKIFEEMDRIQNLPDGIDKAIAFKKYQDGLSQLVPSPWWKKVIAVWKAGLLTGVKTTGLNTLSNLFHGISEVVKDVPAVAVDKVASLFTGERTIGLTARGTAQGVKEGFEKGWRYLKTGFDERDINIKLDRNKMNFGTSPVAKGLQAYEEGIFRLLGAEDQPFYYAAKARSISSQAIAQAKNKGLKGTEAQKFVDELIQNPVDDMLKNAVNDAEISVFQNRTFLGEAAKAVQKIPWGEIVVPFGRTPSSVIMQVINYSPLGAVKTIVEQISKGKFDQRLFSQGIGRSVVGTGVLYIGMELGKKDMVSLGYPKDERTQKQWELEGRVPNSILIEGKWRNPNILGPAGTLLIVGGYIQQGLKETGSLSSALQSSSFGALKSLTDQTFLKGVNQFTDAISDPDRYGVALGSRLIGSAVPTIISDIAQGMDSSKRRTAPNKEGFLAPIKSRIPGVRETLEPTVDVFGRPVERAGNVLETLFDPSRPSNIKSSALIEELKRMAEAGFNATPTKFAEEKSFDVLTSRQKTEIQKNAGQTLEKKLTGLIQHESYKKADDEKKKKMIQDFTDRARVDARVAMTLELTKNLQGENLKSKLSELKKIGFMSREVFKKYAEIR